MAGGEVSQPVAGRDLSNTRGAKASDSPNAMDRVRVIPRSWGRGIAFQGPREGVNAITRMIHEDPSTGR